MDSFGRKFRVSIFGESHGEAIGVVLDGVQPGLQLSVDDFTADILRRKSGAKGTTPRIEADEPEILSGVYNGYTTGAPLTVIFHNRNTRSTDYKLFNDIPRPGHADYTASVKWMDFNDPRGGGHFSGRITLPLVAAGVVAKKMIGCQVNAELIEVGGVTREAALADLFRCGCIKTGCASDFLADEGGKPAKGEKLRNDENESLGGVVSRDPAAHGTGDRYPVPGEEASLSAADIWRKVLDDAIRSQDSVGGMMPSARRIRWAELWNARWTGCLPASANPSSTRWKAWFRMPCSPSRACAALNSATVSPRPACVARSTTIPSTT